MEDVKQKWEDKKHYFEQYKKDGACPPGIDLDRATLGFFGSMLLGSSPGRSALQSAE